MKNIFLLLLAITTSATVFAATEFSSLEEQMTGKQFMEAGLGKLSPEELESLNEWIRSRSLGSLASPKSSTKAVEADENLDRRGLAAEKSDDDDSPIQSRIIGKFSGWDGQTVFKLENGMIWVQDDKDKFYIKEVENPQVTIKPGMFSAWYLSVDGYGSRCNVRRIQ